MSDSVSRVYAQALFELAEGHASRADFHGELMALREVFAENGEIRTFFGSPGTPKSDKRKLIDDVLAPEFDRTTIGFLHLLVRKGREGHLDRILDAYDKLVREAEGRVEVRITSAAPLASGLHDDISRALVAQHGDRLDVHTDVDPRLIGGMKIRIGDRLLDTSIASRLRLLRERMIYGSAS